MTVLTDLTWVDDTDDDQLLVELAGHGWEVPNTPAEGEPPRTAAYQLMPIEQAWLRVEQDEVGRLWATNVADARYPDVLEPGTRIRFDDDSPDLSGWMVTRTDMSGSGRRWVSVLRRPEREAYVALLYDAGGDRPVRSMMVRGVYPDISLAADGQRLVFVEPNREVRGGQRAWVALADPERFEQSRQLVAASETGGIGVKPCSVRRYFKISHGLRSERVWDLVDALATRPRPVPVPGSPQDPGLFDVALLDGHPVLVQAVNSAEETWTLQASSLRGATVLRTWVCATGPGQARSLSAGAGHAVVRVSRDGEETLHRVPVDGFSSGRAPLLASPGLLDTRTNQVTPSIGFAATELAGGIEPFAWYFDRDGECRNDPVAIAARAEGLARAARVRITSDDGYPIDLDLRWPSRHGEVFEGPLLLMLYGAYGLDIDLDSDPDLGQWLGRGFAVATAHVRGGGAEARHLAGTRAKRDRSVADAVAAVRFLRDPATGPVTARHVVTLGASAGGFLSAATMNGCPEGVDACVVVNGFVDPITSLLRSDTQTRASDEDEWGDPANNPNDMATLQAISPVHNLPGSPHAPMLVVVSGKDVRVNPRQGLKLALRYRELGGTADLWFDPQGAHDCWGAGLSRSALVDWVVGALGLEGGGH